MVAVVIVVMRVIMVVSAVVMTVIMAVRIAVMMMVVIVAVIVMMVMATFFPQTAVPRRQRIQVGQVQPFDAVYLRAFLQKRRDEGFQLMADIDDQIGLIDRFRVRRLHLIAVRRALPDKQFRFGDAVHHLGGK